MVEREESVRENNLLCEEMGRGQDMALSVDGGCVGCEVLYAGLNDLSAQNKELKTKIEDLTRERDFNQEGLGEYAEMCDEAAQLLSTDEIEVFRHGLVEGICLLRAERDRLAKLVEENKQ